MRVNNDFGKTLGKRLKEARELLDLTLEEFYERPARIVSRTLGSRYENGEITPRLETLVKLWKTHGINLHWLLTGEGPVFIRKEDSKSRPETLTRALNVLGLEKPLPFMSEDAHIVAAVHYVFARFVDEAAIDNNPENLQKLMNSLLTEDTFQEKYSEYSYLHPVEAAVRAVHDTGFEDRVLSFGDIPEPYYPVVFPIALCMEIPLRDPDAEEGPYTALAFCKDAEYSFIIESGISRLKLLEILRNSPGPVESEELRTQQEEVFKKYLDIVLPAMNVLADRKVGQSYSRKSGTLYTWLSESRKIPPLKLRIPQEVWK